MRKNVGENDKLIVGIKKRIFDLIIEYMVQRPQQVATYLKQIKETCLRSFIGDPNSFVKEASLLLLIQIVKKYHVSVLVSVINPQDLMIKLLDEIKLRKPSSSVKGTIWHLVGLCHEKFEKETRDFLEESQDQMYRELKVQMDKQKPEYKAIVGILQGLTHSLESDCTLEEEEVTGLYLRIKTGM